MRYHPQRHLSGQRSNPGKCRRPGPGADGKVRHPAEKCVPPLRRDRKTLSVVSGECPEVGGVQEEIGGKDHGQYTISRPQGGRGVGRGERHPAGKCGGRFDALPKRDQGADVYHAVPVY